jgi:hypothetical protein
VPRDEGGGERKVLWHREWAAGAGPSHSSGARWRAE